MSTFFYYDAAEVSAVIGRMKHLPRMNIGRLMSVLWLESLSGEAIKSGAKCRFHFVKIVCRGNPPEKLLAKFGADGGPSCRPELNSLYARGADAQWIIDNWNLNLIEKVNLNS